LRQQDELASKQSTPIREDNEDDEDGAGVIRSKLLEERLPLAHYNSGDCDSLLHKQIDELATTVAKQNETIEKFMSLLNIVLKYLDISECTQTPGTLKAELSKIRNSFESRIHLRTEPGVELPSVSTNCRLPPPSRVSWLQCTVKCSNSGSVVGTLWSMA
jgi:hypothetical protein